MIGLPDINRVRGIKASLGKGIVAIVVLLSLLAVRMAEISGLSDLRVLMNILWYVTGAIGALFLVLRRPILGITCASIFIGLLLHSYTRLFLPSLAADIPWLDYHFFGKVSANYCYSLAENYIVNIAVPFFVFGAFFVQTSESNTENRHRFVVMLLLASLICNLFIVALQGLGNVHVLATGSGSAIDANRAPGLLEDSGASTVVLGSLLVFFFVWIAEARWTAKVRVLCLIIWASCVLVGALTKGRIYFVLLIAGLGFFALTKLTRRRPAIKLGLGLVLLVLVSAAFWQFQERFVFGIDSVDAFSHLPLWVRVIGWLDPARGVHSAILWKSLVEYWPLGLGLGGSHIALAQYTTEFSSKNLVVTGDAPLNLYLGFLLETGLGGLFLIFSVLLYTFQFFRYPKDRMHSPFRKAMSVFLLCLLLAGLTGTQILFRSFSCLFALTLAWICCDDSLRRNTNPSFLRMTAAVFAGMAVTFFLAQMTWGFWKPPRVPEFYWSKQGRPQMPLGHNIPIATPGDSQWMPPNVPFAVKDREISFFVELPPQYYPIILSLAIYASADGRKLQEYSFEPFTYNHLSPGKVFSVLLAPEVFAYCSRSFSPESYCFARISMSPTWKISSEISVGFSLMNPNYY